MSVALLLRHIGFTMSLLEHRICGFSVIELDRLTEAELPKHYQKTCSKDAFETNIRYFYKVKSKEWQGSKEEKLRRAVAASYSALRRACGIPNDAPNMTPKEILSRGA